MMKFGIIKLNKKLEASGSKFHVLTGAEDIIFHLTGRIINSREAISLDIDEIIQAANAWR